MTMLTRFGVSPDAEAVYQRLLDGVPIVPGRLAEAAGLDAPVVNDAVEELTHLRLLRSDLPGQTGLTVVPPHVAIETLIRREEEELERRRAELASCRTTASDELLEHYLQSRVRKVYEPVEVTDDWIVARARLRQLVERARTSFCGTHPGEALSPDATEDCVALSRILARNGITGRLIVNQESLGPNHWMAYLEEAVSLGHRVRVLSAVPLLQAVIDGSAALVPYGERVGTGGAYVLHGVDLVAPLGVLFDELWADAVPWEGRGAATRDPEERVSEGRMRQVSALLAGGLKDDTVARRLGMSTRTVRRTIAALMTHLGADTRFQAGVLASAQGWLAAPGRDAHDGEVTRPVQRA